MSWIDILPFVGGLIAALTGGALIADAALADEKFGSERRLVSRAERNRVGQGFLGASLVCTALVLLSGGSSRLAIGITFLGAALLAVGVGLNWRYLAERVSGESRRGRTNASASTDLTRAATATRPAYGWPITSDE